MDASDMQGLLRGYLDELDWSRGVTKDDMMSLLADRDETLRTMVNEYVAEGSYPSADRVMDVIPEEAWQSAQGDTWRGVESQLVEDVPTHFREGQVGKDERDPESASGSAKGPSGNG